MEVDRTGETQGQPVVLRILIVEDTPERQGWLTGLYREHAWVLVHTAARADRLLNAYDFDLISLDYNLAGPDNGAAVARTNWPEIEQQPAACPEGYGG